MEIYCDESGFTGRNLLSEEQPYFVYSAIQFTKEELADSKNIIERHYKLQSGEIKGAKIVNSTVGQKAILEIFEKYSSKARLVFHDKKFALAGKIVEAGVEPYLTSNYHFYTSKLNIYIASGLYVYFMTKQSTAEELFTEFELIAKGKKPIEESLFANGGSGDDLISWVLSLISTNLSIFSNELTTEHSNSRWLLDLTMTSLLGLLSEWFKNGEELDVTCDNSRAFLENPVFEMIQKLGLNGNTADILGTTLGFKLKKQIAHSDSKNSLGIQIADLFSSTVFFCLKNPDKEFSKKILSLVHENSTCTPQSFCLLPETDLDGLFSEKLDMYHEHMMFILWDSLRRNQMS